MTNHSNSETMPLQPVQTSWYKRLWLSFIIGLVIGATAILAIRFVSYKPEHTHYHANFAVYLNGNKFEFKGNQYYQEVAICSASHGINSPQQRAHLHDNINSVVHIHDHATTWGQFFENLGWYVGPDFVQTDSGTLYKADGNNKLHIMIDGQDYTDLTPITNTVIKDDSRLLVSFGDITDANLKQEYNSIPATAKHYDETTDPKSCAGDDKLSLSDRLDHLF